MNIQFEPHKNHIPHFETFFEAYELIDVVFQGDKRFSKKSFQPINERVCLFCNKRFGETTFKSEAHIFPQLMGNKNLISDIECDACNQKFSRLENDLSNYLGVSRTFSGINGDRKPPGFFAEGLNAKSRMFLGNHFIITSISELKEIDNGTFSLSYSKNLYSPSSVYRALIKAAIIIIGKPEIKKEHWPLIYYLNNKIDISSGALIYDYHFSFTINLPFIVYVFKAIRPYSCVFDYIVGVSFYNRMIYVPIPSLRQQKIDSLRP